MTGTTKLGISFSRPVQAPTFAEQRTPSATEYAALGAFGTTLADAAGTSAPCPHAKEDAARSAITPTGHPVLVATHMQWLESKTETAAGKPIQCFVGDPLPKILPVASESVNSLTAGDFDRRPLAGDRRGSKIVIGWAMAILGNADEMRRGWSDKSIARRVRRRIRRVCSYPDALGVTANDRVVVIDGHILSRERELVVVAASDVSGVVSIWDHLTVHPTAGAVPELQGRPRNCPDRWRLWSTGVKRVVLALLGLGLFLGASRIARRS